MGRTVSGTMASILGGSDRKIDYTLDLTFPDSSEFKFATSVLSLAKGDYTNDLESISEIRQTLEAPTDRVSVGIQNKDRVLGLHVAANWQKWRSATAVIGRYYQGGTGFVLTEWVEMFRGSVMQPNANDLQVTFEILHDTISPGLIVCSRNLGPTCPWRYKDAKTCGSTSGETSCNHNLKSKDGCTGRDNTHRFGGMDHFYQIDQAIPGTGGNDNPPGGGTGGPCPRLDQYVLVEGPDDKPVPKMVCFFTEEDRLFNPITKTFHDTNWARIVKGLPISEIITDRGAKGFSSRMHLVLWYKEHLGARVDSFMPGDPVLGWNGRLRNSRCVYAGPAGEPGDVMQIEMKDGHVYCYGDSEHEMIACHNMAKPVE